MSKAAGEQTAWAQRHRMPVVVLRPPAVYGPGDREALRVLQMAARGIILRERVRVGYEQIFHPVVVAAAASESSALPGVEDLEL